MRDNSLNHIMKRIFANIQAAPISGGFTRVPRSWGNLNFVPAVHKFYFILDGEGSISIDGCDYEPKPNQLFLLPAGTRQSLASISNRTFQKYWCHFQASIGETDLFRMIDVPHYIDVPEQDIGLLAHLFRELNCHMSRSEPFAPIMTSSLLLHLLHFYVERAGIHNMFSQSPLSYENLKTVVNYMENHLRDDVTVPELARLIHLDTNYFSRLFKDMIGSSPMQYMNRLRLDQAQALLRDTTMTVTEISAAVGLELHYFSRQFKAHVGFSPLNYRNMASSMARR
ncbi:AraC family transcriptional regulator [Paenibacillus vulneris]|uniref:AraC family transcriptional regulator n=1 Tax=Paenibacillus vulneris TaxID=1133364 RepID=A0ABW3UJC4_9BACL